MLSQSINTEIIKWPDTITQRILSKTYALLLIEDHKIINNFSGIDTEVGWGGGGGGGGIMVFAIEGMQWWFLLFFKKDRSSLQYFMTQGMG